MILNNLSDLYIENIVSDEEYIVMTILIIKNINKLEKLMEKIPEHLQIKKILHSLKEKKIIEIDYLTNEILFIQNKNEKTIESKEVIENKEVENVIEEIESSKGKEIKFLTVKNVDEIKILFNREIAPYELEKIKEWNNKYNFELIKNSIYKASLKNILNLNYIEKIIENDCRKKEKKNQSENVLEKNISIDERKQNDNNEKIESKVKVKRNYEFFDL